MRTVQQGDRVLVHYTKRAEGRRAVSNHGGAPLEITVGTDSRRLPGLGVGLVGLEEGESILLLVPATEAYGPHRPDKVLRLARARFPTDEPLHENRWMRLTDRKGRRRLVRILEIREHQVVVDTNHPWAGKGLALEVQVVSILKAEDEEPVVG